MENRNFYVGQKIRVIDDITYDANICTILLIEPDETYAGLVWLYLKSEYAEDNDNYEPKLNCNIYKIIPADAPYIIIEGDD